MRLATYNVENLFERPRVMNLDTWADGKNILEAYSKFSALIQELNYTDGMKNRMLGYLQDLEVLYLNSHGVLRLKRDPKWACLNEFRGDFISQPKDTTLPVQIVATGRSSWMGWVELKEEAVDEAATRNTAQVIIDTHPDLLGIVEAENRLTLLRFDADLIPASSRYSHIRLIEGNDPRGIDVGIMAKTGFEITAMKTHVDDLGPTGDRLFSRDCPEYEILTPKGNTMWLLINHLKSRGYPGSRNPDDIRREQAAGVRQIYDSLRANGNKYVAIIGDFNDSPNRGPLDPLLKSGSDLVDVSQHPQYQNDGIPGTFGPGNADDKFDYILLSPDLFSGVMCAGIYRKGIYDKRKTPKWAMYPNMTVDNGHPERAASDHALLWADIDV